MPPSLTESFEIALARAVDLAGDESVDLTVLYCAGAVKGCVTNYLQSERVCRHCKAVGAHAYRDQLEGIRRVAVDGYAQEVQASDEKDGKTTQAIEDGVRSTLKTFYRVHVDGDAATKWRYRWAFGLVAMAWRRHSWFIYNALRNASVGLRLDRLEFFNGRIVPTLPAAIAAKHSGIDFAAIEVAGKHRALYVAHNNSVHSLSYIKGEIRRYLDKASCSELGQEFFELRRHGMRTDDRSYVSAQQKGRLRFKHGNKVLAIFTSSMDELEFAGDEWFTQASRKPEDFILALRERLPRDFALFVRMHPNQAGDRTGASSRMIKRLGPVPGIELIKPQSPESSYELLDRADYVLTFGSTIGLEATYWGKTSLLAGRAIWEDLEITYQVDTPDDVAALIEGGAGPRAQQQAAAVGAFLMDSRTTGGSLTWSSDSDQFFVRDRNYLSLKRSSLVYFATRAVDKILRMKW